MGLSSCLRLSLSCKFFLFSACPSPSRAQWWVKFQIDPYLHSIIMVALSSLVDQDQDADLRETIILKALSVSTTWLHCTCRIWKITMLGKTLLFRWSLKCDFIFHIFNGRHVLILKEGGGEHWCKEGGGAGCGLLDYNDFLQSVADADRDEFGFIDKTQDEPGTCQVSCLWWTLQHEQFAR